MREMAKYSALRIIVFEDTFDERLRCSYVSAMFSNNFVFSFDQ